jgi:hypothetical protein
MVANLAIIAVVAGFVIVTWLGLGVENEDGR